MHPHTLTLHRLPLQPSCCSRHPSLALTPLIILAPPSFSPLGTVPLFGCVLHACMPLLHNLPLSPVQWCSHGHTDFKYSRAVPLPGLFPPACLTLRHRLVPAKVLRCPSRVSLLTGLLLQSRTSPPHCLDLPLRLGHPLTPADAAATRLKPLTTPVPRNLPRLLRPLLLPLPLPLVESPCHLTPPKTPPPIPLPGPVTWAPGWGSPPHPAQSHGHPTTATPHPPWSSPRPLVETSATTVPAAAAIATRLPSCLPATFQPACRTRLGAAHCTCVISKMVGNLHRRCRCC